MKKISLIFLLALSTFVYSNNIFTKDTINNFSLSFKSTGWTGIEDNIIVDAKGNVTAVRKLNNGDVLAKKVIKLDANTFRQFKNSFINDSKFFTLPEIVNCENCHDGSIIEINLNCNLGKRKVSGSNPGSVNENVENAINMIYDLVGTLGDASDYGK